MDENVITVVDEDGNEVEMEVLLTFDDEENEKSYVLLIDPVKNDEIYAYQYTEDGDLFAVEDGEEWNMCVEVLNSFIDEEGIDDTTN